MASFEMAGSHPEDTIDAKCAIDDSVDEDEEMVEIRRIQSAEHKRQRKDSTAQRVQSIVPFHFRHPCVSTSGRLTAGRPGRRWAMPKTVSTELCL
ncbi:hypothetical protein HYQ44_014429 [Verticillium longisporum]|nr:hypothetical protein HYQ44_014429 [Verticillium longisporum]